MAKRKSSTVTKRKATKRKPTTRRSRSSSVDHGRFLFPLVIGAAVLFGLGFAGLKGYRAAIASDFFNVKHVEVVGAARTKTEDVKGIVNAGTQSTGVWRSDLEEIRAKVEKLAFVKQASVSMVLPSGIRVNITEKIPVAMVKVAAGEVLVDSDGNFIDIASSDDKTKFTLMRGWDETKGDKVVADNKERLKIYKKMRDEWSSLGITERVKEVDLKDPRDPHATIEDSGRTIAVFLSKDNLGKGLKSAIEAVAGKGDKVKAVNSGGVFPVLEYLGN
jgi:cell division septal protein FtsQ